MVVVFDEYFHVLFQSSKPSTSLLSNVLIKLQVTLEINELLLSSYAKEKVKEALFQMVPLKSLGLDRFSACFYQTYWHIVRDEVCSTITIFS